MMKKSVFRLLWAAALLLAALSGCGRQPGAAPPLEAVAYSNLTDADSRSLLSALLADAGVDESRTRALLDRVDRFNASVKSQWLTDGFESAAPTYTKYDPNDMHDLCT